MYTDDTIVVTGAGGFIGGHLVKDLVRQGHQRIKAVDIKPIDQWHQVSPNATNLQRDLRKVEACRQACADGRWVFNLAADMGGMGYIETHKANCMLSVLISTHMLMAAQECGVERFFYSSSACIYPANKQTNSNVQPLKEDYAYPAQAEDGYGWEKLFTERMCRHFNEDFGLLTRIARYHNVYGPEGTYIGGREKAPAAVCRKVAEAAIHGTDEIEIWGDGTQTRSFMYVDDCIIGTQRIIASDVNDPLNLGSDQLVSINELVDLVERIAGTKLRRRYNLDAPQGVKGRNSDNTLISQRLNWAPSISLELGLEETYRWIFDQLTRRRAAA